MFSGLSLSVIALSFHRESGRLGYRAQRIALYVTLVVWGIYGVYQERKNIVICLSSIATVKIQDIGLSKHVTGYLKKKRLDHCTLIHDRIDKTLALWSWSIIKTKRSINHQNSYSCARIRSFVYHIHELRCSSSPACIPLKIRILLGREVGLGQAFLKLHHAVSAMNNKYRNRQ